MRALAVLALFASILPAAAHRELRTEERVRSVARALYRALARSDAGKLAVLVSSDADLRVGTGLVATGPDAILAALRTRPVWSELSPPWLEGISVRLLSTDTAAVDAQQIRFGSAVGRQSSPVLILLRRRGVDWQVVSMRLQHVCMPWPRVLP